MGSVVDLESERDARKLADIAEWARMNLTLPMFNVASERYTIGRLEESRIQCAAIMSRLQEQA